MVRELATQAVAGALDRLHSAPAEAQFRLFATSAPTATKAAEVAEAGARTEGATQAPEANQETGEEYEVCMST